MRGITIAIFMLCVAVFSGVMAAGVNQELGLGLTTDLNDETQRVNDTLGGDQNLSERGGGTGLLGFAVFAVKQLAVFGVLVGSIASVILAWGPPHPAFVALAVGIELIARVIEALGLIWIARGVIGE
jgi:hypothetical protein